MGGDAAREPRRRPLQALGSALEAVRGGLEILGRLLQLNADAAQFGGSLLLWKKAHWRTSRAPRRQAGKILGIYVLYSSISRQGIRQRTPGRPTRRVT
jgi:hypothetical protein